MKKVGLFGIGKHLKKHIKKWVQEEYTAGGSDNDNDDDDDDDVRSAPAVKKAKKACPASKAATKAKAAPKKAKGAKKDAGEKKVRTSPIAQQQSSTKQRSPSNIPSYRSFRGPEPSLFGCSLSDTPLLCAGRV